MQISGANLLLASQQAAPAAAPAPGFAQALRAGGFTPRDLTAPEPAAAAGRAQAPKAAQTGAAPTGPVRPGMHLDLKV